MSQVFSGYWVLEPARQGRLRKNLNELLSMTQCGYFAFDSGCVDSVRNGLELGTFGQLGRWLHAGRGDDAGMSHRNLHAGMSVAGGFASSVNHVLPWIDPGLYLLRLLEVTGLHRRIEVHDLLRDEGSETN